MRSSQLCYPLGLDVVWWAARLPRAPERRGESRGRRNLAIETKHAPALDRVDPLLGDCTPGVPSLPDWSLRRGGLCVRFARGEDERERTLALRYDVFAREKGCNTSGQTGLEQEGREQDEFDDGAHHLLVEDLRRGEVVGTYRLITAELAAAGPGFYSAREFELEALPRAVLAEGVELGRACVARERRGGPALSLLLAGVTQYLLHNRKRYFFGCASLPTLDPVVVASALELLRSRGALDDRIRVRARADYRARGAAPGPRAVERARSARPLPALVERYLALGAKVCSEPAYDHDFRGADLLVVLDVAAIAPDVVDGYARGRP